MDDPSRQRSDGVCIFVLSYVAYVATFYTSFTSYFFLPCYIHLSIRNAVAGTLLASFAFLVGLMAASRQSRELLRWAGECYDVASANCPVWQAVAD